MESFPVHNKSEKIEFSHPSWKLKGTLTDFPKQAAEGDQYLNRVTELHLCMFVVLVPFLRDDAIHILVFHVVQTIHKVCASVLESLYYIAVLQTKLALIS